MRYPIYIFFILALFFNAASINAQTKYNLPSNFYEADCVYNPADFEMTIAQRSISKENDVSTYYSVAVGDLDGDGFGEIVIPGISGLSGNTPNIFYIFNHKAELIERVSLPVGCSMNTDYDSVILADLDNDGKGEIIISASNGKKLLIYDIRGNILAEETFSHNFPKTMGVADFDNDGVPEIYIGNRIYRYANNNIILLAKIANPADDNITESTDAQDIDGDGIPELISANNVYEVTLITPNGEAGNSITKTATCTAIKNVPSGGIYTSRTFALADIDLDGTIDVVTLVPIFNSDGSRIEVTVWNPKTGRVKYDRIINTCSGGSFIRNSWPFIGDTDNNGFPDIIFMGGINKQYCTLVYRLEYDKNSVDVVIRATNDSFDDYSSMSTSMSMFDFNNDGKQEIVYRDEKSLYIVNGEDLTAEMSVPESTSGTGWEYPVVASLTPSGESSIIIASGTAPGARVGTLRIYGADVENGGEPWMPAREVWNQYSFYQNLIYDNLKIIPNPASLNTVLTSEDGSKTMQPFNGHMSQLGIIKPSTLEPVFPVANLTIHIDKITYGFNRVDDKLEIDFVVSNTGDAAMDPDIDVEIVKVVGETKKLIDTYTIKQAFLPGDELDIDITVDNFKQHYPFDQLEVSIGSKKLDCDITDNSFVILPKEIEGVLYVKKGNTGNGESWSTAMGELADALLKAKEYNAIYPYSLTKVWVAEGTYLANFEMQEGVNIYGGFEGNESDINQSRPLHNPTILDAQNNGRPLTQTVSYTVPTTWRGLTLQNGNTANEGGGAFIREGGILAHSIIKNNRSTSTKGGGVYANKGQVVNCIIEENKLASPSARGAGLYLENGSYAINNTIVKNSIESTSGQGGGVYADNSFVYNNIIYSNKVDDNANNIDNANSTILNNLANNDDSVDPQFLNFEHSDYQLLPISPVLNVGENLHITGWGFDIMGDDRIYKNMTVDLGAIEYQAAKVAPSEEGYFYVNETKDGNGADWTNAVKYLSDALTGAKFLNEHTPNTVKKIWVAKGTYKGRFEMVEGADLHGGFAGNETDFNQMDTVKYKTYLDAEKQGRVLSQEKAFDTPTEWSGVILQNGLENGIDYDVYGGGAYLKKNGTLRYSTIRNSEAIATSIHNKVNAYGGGVYMEEGANLLNSIIDNNMVEVDNQNPDEIESGVALGGGINNVNNELAYLIVRHNKAISDNDTDGSAIYSSGDIINSIINNNIGKSALWLGNNVKATNNTIVANEGESTIAGSNTAKTQNSIIYNNKITTTEINKVQYENLYNLINIDPKFEVNSFKFSNLSPARNYGKASLFPTHFDKDIENELRIITLKNNVRIIDAGAYQTTIKVVSATAIAIEVPFDTDFLDIDFKELINGLLEFDYNFECNTSWLEGDYNQLKDGDYLLYGNLSNLPEGVINPDNVKGTIIVTVKKNHIADMEDLFINNEQWFDRLDENYIIDCDYMSKALPIDITLPYFAAITFDPIFTHTQVGNIITVNPDVSKPGKHLIKATIVSQDGKNTKEYEINIVRHFPFWDIIEQKWNNTFVINNNELNNGGYNFASYRWYKKDIEIGAKQYYSAGETKNDVLDESSLYHADMVGVDGTEYSTCKAHPILTGTTIRVSPNPVRRGELITIEVPLEINQTGKVNIYSLSGMAVANKELIDKITTIEAPLIGGLYIVKISLNGGASESVRVIVH